jgi:23S rRNA pseudouridine1911/1915/1917 synthase
MKTNNSFSDYTVDRSNVFFDKQPELIYRDKYLAVINKPAGMASQPGKKSGPDVITALSGLLKLPADRIFLVNRLDQTVSGLMLVAFSSEIQSKLSHEQLNKSISKQYLAITLSGPESENGRLTDYLLRNGKSNTSKIVDAGIKGSKKAVLFWEKISSLDIALSTQNNIKLSLLRIRLETGRHHQIRVQLSGKGWPILNDVKYYRLNETGMNLAAIHSAIENKLQQADFRAEPKGAISLISWSVEFKHPVSQKILKFVLPYPINGAFCLFSDVQSRLDHKQNNKKL